MSDTVNVYTADGATTDFTIAFSYLDQDFIIVKVEDEGLTDVTGSHPGSMLDASTFRFDAAVPNNYRVTFTRTTDLSTELFTWAAGAIFRPSDIGDSMKMLRDYTEETRDQVGNTVINAQTDAVTQATSQATASASAASTSEVNAASSASAASTSEVNAASSASAASTSAASALTSEGNASNSASAAQTAQAAAESALNQLLNKYHGSHANDSACEADIAGDADLSLESGDLYFNTTSGTLRYYDGSAWYDAAATQIINTSSLSNVGDVTVSGLTTGDLLRRDASGDWVNYPDSNFATAAQGTLADSATQPGDLATVATSGLYSDLSGTPTLATVATSGLYSDLSGTPDLGNIPQNAPTGAYTLVVGDAGGHVSADSNVTVDASVFSVGDAVSIYNETAGDITITQGTSVTLRSAGTADTGDRTLAQYGLCTLLCVGTDTFVISGVGLT